MNPEDVLASIGGLLCWITNGFCIAPRACLLVESFQLLVCPIEVWHDKAT